MSEQYKEVTIPKQPGSQYSNDQRIAVIADYFVTGNISKAAEMHNIPRTTVDGWIKSDWGVELLVTIRHEKGEEFDANVTKLIDSAFEEAQDRVENGDQKLVKVKRTIKHDDGSMEVVEDYELKRQPMTGKDLTVVAGISYEKRQLHRNQPTAITGSMDTRALAEQCMELSRTMRDHGVVSVQTKSKISHNGDKTEKE